MCKKKYHILVEFINVKKSQSNSHVDLQNSQNGSGGCYQSNEQMVVLQRALGAAALQSSFHLLGVRGAVCASENRLPSSALGDATANTRGRCCLAGSGTIHAGNLSGGRACFQGVVAFQQLPHHLSLTCKLCLTAWPGVPRLTVADGLSSLGHVTLPVSAALPSAGWRLLPSITVLTLVAFTALAAVGLTLWHTQTLNTSAVLTGTWCRRLITQGPAASWRTITCYPRLSSLPARTLGAYTAGMAPCEKALTLGLDPLWSCSS